MKERIPANTKKGTINRIDELLKQRISRDTEIAIEFLTKTEVAK